MSKIPTVEKCLTVLDEFEVLETRQQEEAVIKAMIEFAKLHVEAALKAASENVIVNNYCGEGGVKINKYSILNAYPLTNIK